MKKLLLIALLSAAVSAAIWKFRKTELNLLQAETHRETLLWPTAGADGEKPVEVDPAELKRLRAARLELARWRGTVSSLRQQTNQTPEEIGVQATKTLAEANLIRARHASGEQSKHVGEKLNFAIMLLTGVASKTEGGVPATWEEVRTRIDQGAQGGDPMLVNLKAMLEQYTSEPKVAAEFDLVPVPAGTQIRSRKLAPALPVIRERQSRPQPDGGASRFYGWLNHYTEDVYLPDGNFAAWEAQHFRPGVARNE